MLYHCENIPTAEIDNAIRWYKNIKDDCDYKISRLVSLKQNRARAQNWRDNMNDLARLFMHDDGLHLDLETRTQIVFQRLDVDHHRAQEIAKLVHAWAKRRKRELRDMAIKADYAAGLSAQKIAEKHNISRQQVHRLVKENFIS